MADLGGAWGRLPENAVAVFCNTGKEVEQTYQFVKDFEENTGCLVTWLEYDRDDTRKGGLKDPKVLHKVVGFETASRNGEPFEKMIRGKRYAPNVAHRICTADLKVHVCDLYLRRELKVASHRNIIGFRWDEPKRWNASLASAKATSKYDAVDLFDSNGDAPPDDGEESVKPPCSGRIKDYPLVLAEVTKRMVEDFWKPIPWGLRMNSDYGNCDLCFLKGREKVLNIIREKPELADWWIKAENIVKNRDAKKRKMTKSAGFNQNWSYENLKLIATSGLDLGDLPPDDSPHLPCFCFD